MQQRECLDGSGYPRGLSGAAISAPARVLGAADAWEVFEAGDAFYMPPGHVPAAVAGTELVQFSPGTQLAEVLTAMAANAQRLAPSS